MRSEFNKYVEGLKSKALEFGSLSIDSKGEFDEKSDLSYIFNLGDNDSWLYMTPEEFEAEMVQRTKSYATGSEAQTPVQTQAKIQTDTDPINAIATVSVGEIADHALSTDLKNCALNDASQGNQG